MSVSMQRRQEQEEDKTESDEEGGAAEEEPQGQVEALNDAVLKRYHRYYDCENRIS